MKKTVRSTLSGILILALCLCAVPVKFAWALNTADGAAEPAMFSEFFPSGTLGKPAAPAVDSDFNVTYTVDPAVQKLAKDFSAFFETNYTIVSGSGTGESGGSVPFSYREVDTDALMERYGAAYIAAGTVFDYRVDDGDWHVRSQERPDFISLAAFSCRDTLIRTGTAAPYTDSVRTYSIAGNGAWIPDLAEHTVYIRYFSFVEADYSDENGNFAVRTIVSDWSDAAAIGKNGPAPGEKTYIADPWALPEMKEADEKGLIPECLDGVDLKKRITRQEFAAVSVKVYEALSGKTAELPAVNPFNDTDDETVLKAYNTGITDGTSKGRFSPESILTREQAVTMLTRVWKKLHFEGWTLETDKDFDAQFHAAYAMPEKFGDDEKISDWAYDSVYFMAANHIVEGSNETFKPRPLTESEKKAGFAQATREQAIAIALRMVNNLK